MNSAAVSARGVYYDLEKSPYVLNAYGENFKFSSRKKMEIFTREYPKRIAKLEKMYSTLGVLIGRLDLAPADCVKRRIVRQLYNEVEKVN